MNDLFLYLFFAGIAWLVWRAFTGKPTPPPQAIEQPPKEDKEARHLCNTRDSKSVKSVACNNVYES